MRIGIGGLSCECCTFSPLASRREDFVLLEGETLLAHAACATNHPDVQLIPLIRARALPGGPVDPEFYAEFRTRLLDGLTQSAPLDGLSLHMHGAVYVSGMDDAEGDLLAAVRDVVGPDCLISASYDLHGNLSQRVVDDLDLLTAYRTAPHIDTQETMQRASTLLIDCVRSQAKPAKAFIRVPILLPGEQTSTEWEPAASLYAALPDLIDQYKLMDASILIGYVWADEPRATATVVTFGSEAEATQEAAAELAGRLWCRRKQFAFGVPAHSVDDCIDIAVQAAMSATERPVIISDSGDNPTAGGAGDVPYVLERLLALGAQETLLASIPDPAAVAQCAEAGAGATVSLVLGGKLDPVHGKPLLVRGKVRSLHSRPAGASGERRERVAVLQTRGVQVIITEQRTPFHHLRDFEQLDLDPRAFQIIVVKMGYLVPELNELAARSLLALSPGAVDQDITRLPFRRLARPLYPFDPDMDWEPPARTLAGRPRRGLQGPQGL